MCRVRLAHAVEIDDLAAVLGEQDVALTSFLPIARDRDRLQGFLDVRGNHVPRKLLPILGPEPELLHAMLLNPRAIRGADDSALPMLRTWPHPETWVFFGTLGDV